MKTYGYKLSITNIGFNISKREIIDIYSNIQDDIKIRSPKFETTTYCHTARTDIIIEIEYNSIAFKIGIVHLCGGKFDDLQIISKSKTITIDDEIEYKDDEYDNEMFKNSRDYEWIDLLKFRMEEEEHIKMKEELIKINEAKLQSEITELTKIKKMKSEQIKKMIDNNVDIILGDFNSDFELFLGINSEELINYFRNEAKLDDKQIKIWNTYIYNLLKKKQYYNICEKKSNCIDFYKKRHTSIYNSSPDVIYYKKQHLEVINYEIINIIRGNYSDHNGIYASFSIK